MCENNDLSEQTDPEQLTGESADSQVRRPINIVGPEPLLLKFPLADHYRHAYPQDLPNLVLLDIPRYCQLNENPTLKRQFVWT